MKKTFFLLAIVCMMVCSIFAASAEPVKGTSLTPGTTIMFGQYEQDNNAKNGKEPIEWIVLDIQGSNALLISKYALDCLPFNEKQADLKWEESSIRGWLNVGFFSSSFTENEKQAIALTSIHNAAEDGIAEYNPTDAEKTEDRVFLLSYREAMYFFPEQNDRKVTGTEYARSKGARFMGITTIGIGETDWWLRSPGRATYDAAFVNVYGGTDTKNISTNLGVRPALCLDLTANSDLFPYTSYTKATALADQQNYAEAAEIFEFLGDYYNSPAMATNYRYLQALQAISTGNYGNAAEVFESLGDYKNSAAMATNCRYLQALQAVNSGNYDLAIQLFEKLDKYEDSYEQGRAARYAKAVAYQEAGDYATAIKLFGEVGQYKDSMAHLKACFEKQGISQYYFSVDPVNAGVDTGYSKTDPIQGNDKHFGWRLGRFFVSGYTRVINNNSDNPVFIKTLGDSVTLWFDLEQDINALTGNTNLIVGEDQNGYDQSFGVQKTNFGRGTLIIRHTDYRNAKGDPVIYTDYLLAKGTTGADTKVVLNEEGDYEVALDYELQDNDLTHITNKFGNYRISFKFSIRNGNCMVYPFDVMTKAELQNTSFTENGFYLDLARSRYLDIDVRRSVIVQGPTGMIEDERFNRPAKDGDQYTAEGIYTISVSNRYTGESTVKTIFVGTEELLQEYIANGFSMDRLK